MGASVLNMEDLPHYTYDDYKQWEGKWEIICGIPYSLGPAPAIKHQDISLEIAAQLREKLKTCGGDLCKVHLPIDWKIEEDTVVQPDVMVVCGENRDENILTITPTLVFEIISPSSKHRDRVLKYGLYKEAGVKYYCLIDPMVKSVEVFLLRGTDYQEEKGFEEGKIPFQLGECVINLDVSTLFDI